MADKKIQEKSRKPLLLLKEEELLAEEVKKSPSLNSINNRLYSPSLFLFSEAATQRCS